MILNLLSDSSSAAGGSSAGSVLVMVFYIALLFVIMYFLMIRPQRREQKRMNSLLDSMEVGDVVVTASGFYGIVISITDDDCIVEFGNNKNCRIPMRKSAIAEVEKASDGVETKDDTKSTDSTKSTAEKDKKKSFFGKAKD